MNCDQVRSEIIAYLKGELDDEREQRILEHLAGCPACRKELDGARKLLSWTEAASEEVVTKALEGIIDQAIADSASDIHFQPVQDNSLNVRYRVDGVLHDVATVAPIHRQGLVARIKMLAGVTVSDSTVPQDGRFEWKSGERGYDIRVSVVPLVLGESIVMRVLDRSASLISLDKTGISSSDLEKLKRLVGRPMGMVFTSGPTGSGKTTILYSLLQTLVSGRTKIMTVEDPVEYIIGGIDQIHIHVKGGLTWASALRGIMRHDPDVIMLGEIRDAETINLCVRAALGGHLVLSQVHTQEAVEVIERLRGLEVKDYLIAASLVGGSSQRLVRKVCSHCAEESEADMDDPVVRFFGIPGKSRIRRGTGCEECRHTGFYGRTTLFEVLEIDRELSKLIANGADTGTILEAAKKNGFHSMRDDAREKILAGITTPEEAFRVLA